VFSERLDICGLFALRTLLPLEAHFLVFLQRFEAAALDLGKMREQVFSARVRRDETKALRIVETTSLCLSASSSSKEVEESHSPCVARFSRPAAGAATHLQTRARKTIADSGRFSLGIRIVCRL
jgi:hypothetical protein